MVRLKISGGKARNQCSGMCVQKNSMRTQAENVKSFQSSVQILYIVHCEFIIHCMNRVFANMVGTTVRIDHFCTENLYCDFRLH